MNSRRCIIENDTSTQHPTPHTAAPPYNYNIQLQYMYYLLLNEWPPLMVDSIESCQCPLHLLLFPLEVLGIGFMLPIGAFWGGSCLGVFQTITNHYDRLVTALSGRVDLGARQVWGKLGNLLGLLSPAPSDVSGPCAGEG